MCGGKLDESVSKIWGTCQRIKKGYIWRKSNAKFRRIVASGIFHSPTLADSLSHHVVADPPIKSGQSKGQGKHGERNRNSMASYASAGQLAKKTIRSEVPSLLGSLNHRVDINRLPLTPLNCPVLINPQSSLDDFAICTHLTRSVRDASGAFAWLRISHETLLGVGALAS